MAAGVAADEPGVTAGPPPANSSSLWPATNTLPANNWKPPYPQSFQNPAPANFQYSALRRPLRHLLGSSIRYPVISSFRRLRLPLQRRVVYCSPHHTTMSPKLRPAGRGVIPRIGSSLYTAKHPGRCPNCGSTNLSRKGSRRKKFETVQRWQCNSCGRGFTPAPPELRAKTYPLRVILDGVTLYNLGYTLAEPGPPFRGKACTAARMGRADLASRCLGNLRPNHLATRIA
jgi:predicted RNA-binding Zn-ribbon protein involved in translation (DUF1610 family)